MAAWHSSAIPRCRGLAVDTTHTVENTHTVVTTHTVENTHTAVTTHTEVRVSRHDDAVPCSDRAAAQPRGLNSSEAMVADALATAILAGEPESCDEVLDLPNVDTLTVGVKGGVTARPGFK